MIWTIYSLNGVLGVVPQGDAIPSGATEVGYTSDPDYLQTAYPRVITRLQFRRRFTFTERVAIDAAPDNQMIDATTRNQVRTMLTDLAMAEEVNLTDGDIVTGLGILESAGLIAQGRAAEILA